MAKVTFAGNNKPQIANYISNFGARRFNFLPQYACGLRLITLRHHALEFPNGTVFS